MHIGSPNVGFFTSASAPGVIVNAVAYDGSTQLLHAGTGILSSSTIGTISCWVRLDGGDGVKKYILNSLTTGSTRISLTREATNKFKVDLLSSGGSSEFSFGSNNTYLSGALWHHIAVAWNTNFAAGSKLGLLYIDGVSDSVVISDAAAAFTVSGGTNQVRVMAQSTTLDTTLLQGALAELFVDTGTYFDFTSSAQLQKFRTSGGLPVDLGATGSTPSGSSPELYLRSNAASAGTNSGTGANLTITGTPTDTTGPV